ncbi:MAG: PP2C family protein-serine/threonine phosphatase, partial [Bifidobacterium dentium]
EAVVRHCAQLGAKAARNRHDIEETLNAAQREVLALGESLGGIAGTTISGVIMPADIDDMTAHAADANSIADGNDSCYIVNIGDSRTYHMCAAEDGGWDASTFTRITRDHSERQNAIDSGEMLPEEALRNIPRNIITQCIGAPNGIAPDYYAADAFGRFIICSDGLHAEVDKERFAAIAAADNDPQTAADALVKAALRAGGNDNVTVVVVDMITPSPIGREWTVGKLAEHEDIGDLQDGTLQTLRTIDVRRS